MSWSLASQRAMFSKDSGTALRRRSSGSRLPSRRRSTNGSEVVRAIGYALCIAIGIASSTTLRLGHKWAIWPSHLHLCTTVCIMLCMAKRVGPQTTAQLIGKRLLVARTEEGLTQSQAAMRLAQWMPSNYSPHSSTISRIETAASGEPDVYLIAALARVYHRQFEDIAPELLEDADRMRLLLNEVVDLRGQEFTHRACNQWAGSQDPLPFDDFDLRLVIDLRDHVVTNVAYEEPLALLANAS